MIFIKLFLLCLLWAGATPLQGYDTAAEDTTATVYARITGECANAGDTITEMMWLVEPK